MSERDSAKETRVAKVPSSNEIVEKVSLYPRLGERGWGIEVRTLLILLLLPLTTLAQPDTAQYTLQRCISLALENNLQVRQSGWQADQARVNITGAFGNMLPYATGSVNHGINQGRGLDPTTNTYIDQQINFANYNLNGNLTLWNGLNLQNALQQSRLAYQAGRMDLQQIRETTAINVILAYLQVLNADEQVNQARQQVEVSRRQVERLQVLDSNGAVAPAQLHDLRGQLGTDRLNETAMKNNANAARLSLAQLVNIAFSPAMHLAALPETALPETATPIDPDRAYQSSLNTLPMVKAADLRVRSARRGLRGAQGLWSPSVYAFGNLGTTYSSAANRPTGPNTTEPIPYGTQWTNNRYSAFGIGVQVPIITAFQTRTRVGMARIAERQADFQARTVKTQVQQQVEQAVLNRQLAQERYQTSVQQVNDFTLAFQAAEARFEAGVGTSVDYMVAKANLDRARSNLISARYDLTLRGKIVEYYEGKPLL